MSAAKSQPLNARHSEVACLTAPAQNRVLSRAGVHRVRRPLKLGAAAVMIGFDTAVFTDPDDYGMSAPGASFRLVLIGSGDFSARRTWVHIGRLSLARNTETVPRIAFVVPAPGAVFVSFPTRHEPTPIWSGLKMKLGEFMVHGRGAPTHQCTHGATQWGFIALAARDLAGFGRVASVELRAPQTTKITKPTKTAAAELLRQYGDMCRLAETEPARILDREVARELEQNLLRGLINCLAAAEGYEFAGARQHRAQFMARFEEVLACHARPLEPSMPELAAAVGTSDRNLRNCCREFLGMSPGQYAHLRRLSLVRAALWRADPATATVTAIATQYGFSELGRFAGEYRTAFGELPSATLSRVRCNSHDMRSPQFA
jgi:AraC-like DNA-binding protein